MAIPTEREHWPRWTKIAFFKMAESVKRNIPVYFEGDERTTRLNANFTEVRLTGPDIWEPSRDCYKLEVIFNLLINSKEDSDDLYLVDRLQGQFTNAFPNSIRVLKMGSDAVDDESLLGCYQLVSPIDINQFGIIDGSLRVNQTTIEGTYELTLAL